MWQGIEEVFKRRMGAMVDHINAKAHKSKLVSTSKTNMETTRVWQIYGKGAWIKTNYSKESPFCTKIFSCRRENDRAALNCHSVKKIITLQTSSAMYLPVNPLLLLQKHLLIFLNLLKW